MKDQHGTGRILGFGEDEDKKKKKSPSDTFVPSEYNMYPDMPHQSTGGAPPPPDTPDWLSDFNSWAVYAANAKRPVIGGKLQQKPIIISDPGLFPEESQYVTWETEINPCDTCKANQAAGILKRGQLFPGGVSSPPQHMGCKCILLPALDDAHIIKVSDFEKTLYIIEPNEPKEP